MADTVNTNTTVPQDSTGNWTKTPEQLKEESKAKDEEKKKENEEKRKAKMAFLKDPKVIFGALLLITQIIIVIVTFQSCSGSKRVQDNQVKLSKAVEEYISADKIVAEQVVQNQSEIININSKLESYDKKFEEIDEELNRAHELTEAVTRINKLAIMNRNRIYSVIMKEDPFIEAAFSEEKLAGEEIQENTNNLILAMSKAVGLKVEESKEAERKEKAKADPCPVKKEPVIETEEIEEQPVFIQPPEPPKKKRDFFLFLKPWKWFGRK